MVFQGSWKVYTLVLQLCMMLVIVISEVLSRPYHRFRTYICYQQRVPTGERVGLSSLHRRVRRYHSATADPQPNHDLDGEGTCIKTHMCYSQEAHDAECAALARALESAVRRHTTPERVPIFTDAQAAIKRMATEEPGPGQMYAIQVRRHVAALRKA